MPIPTLSLLAQDTFAGSPLLDIDGRPFDDGLGAVWALTPNDLIDANALRTENRGGDMKLVKYGEHEQDAVATGVSGLTDVQAGRAVIRFRPGLTQTYMQLLVQAHADSLTCYRLSFQAIDFGDPTPTFLWALEELGTDAPASNQLRSGFNDPITIAVDTDYDVVLAMYQDAGDWILEATVDTGSGPVAIVRFNLATDISDWTGELVDVHTGGAPGVGMFDQLGVGAQSEITLFEVLGLGGAIPCEGGPEFPYPHEPYPVPPVVDALMYLRQGGRYLQVVAPSLTSPESVLARARGAGRGSSAYLLRYQGHYLGTGNADQLPPPETPNGEDPYYDPCGDLPELPPPGDVTLVALTGRIFGVSQVPPSLCGPLYTGTKSAIGGWIPGYLAICQAKGAKMITAQGPYGQYQPDGVWNLDAFIAISIAKISAVYSALVDYLGRGVYIGHSIADDWESNLWRPSGIPLGDLLIGRAAIQAEFPALPLGIRSLTTQFPSDPGFAFYNQQFKSWGGYSAFNFGATMYARALGWNAASFFDLNYLAGGNGSSGVRIFDGTMLSGHFAMSGAEIAEYLTDIYSGALSIDGTCAKMYGSLGYTWDPDRYFNVVPGVYQGQAAARNALAALPAL